jgi:hypothetical protein
VNVLSAHAERFPCGYDGHNILGPWVCLKVYWFAGSIVFSKAGEKLFGLVVPSFRRASVSGASAVVRELRCWLSHRIELCGRREGGRECHGKKADLLEGEVVGSKGPGKNRPQ